MGFFKSLWEGWKKVARKIGDFQARLILAVFYFIILAPFSFLVRASDPLAIGRKAHKGWIAKTPDHTDVMVKATRQW